MFGNIVGDGAGQTIAIIDAYHYATAAADLHTFNLAFGLPDPPSFLQVAQDGSQNFPPTDPAGPGNSWALEAAMDIQWSHAMAPGANIVLVEANDNSYNNLIQAAANWARNNPATSVISMSFGGGEFSSELSFDSYFTTPANHQGVTFVASTGDSGQPGGYPAYSPNVVAVGGTSLFLSGGEYASESAWSGSGGGISIYQSKPSYQADVTQSGTRRTTPDLALVANPSTGVAVYDSWDNPSSPWIQVGGTSLSAPLFAGMLAIADQGRVLAGKGTLDGRNDTLPILYAAPAADFHDVISGSNGFSAGVGYDLATGRGTPIGNLLIHELVGVVGSISGHTFTDVNSNGFFDASDTPLSGVTVYLDANGNGSLDLAGSQTATTATLNSIVQTNNTPLVSSQTISGLAGAVADVNVTLSLVTSRDSNFAAYLVAPDGTQVTLFSAIGGFGANFTNTTLDDQAGTAIASSSAPFTGTFRPTGALASLNGKAASGIWQLVVTNSSRRNTGTLVSWSLSVATAPEASTTSGADGSFTFSGLVPGAYTVRDISPADLTPSGATSYQFNVQGDVTGANFAYAQPLPVVQAVPPSLSGVAGDLFYVWRDGDMLDIGRTLAPINPVYQSLLSDVQGLNFALSGAKLVVDFSGGSPLPAGGIFLEGADIFTSELDLKGAGQPFIMTDSQIAPSASADAITFAHLGTLSLEDALVTYTGDLSGVQVLNINGDTVLNWL